MSTSSAKSVTTSSSDDENPVCELRRGPWTMEEDTILVHFIACHGEGRWNLLAKRSGLRRTGKSCRLRWLNYLKPDVKRGNLSPEEQLLILDLHSKWGNRWSKIAQYLPGRTDNEIKNYWRTRVQKQAKHLKIDVESDAFQDIIRQYWMPRLIQKIEGSSSNTSPTVLVDILQDSSSLGNPVDVPLSSVESMNISRVSQFSEQPSNVAFQQTTYDGQITYTNNTNSMFYEECSYYNAVDMFDQTGLIDAKAHDNLAGVCHMDGGDWANNDFFGDMLNMDDLWQNKS